MYITQFQESSFRRLAGFEEDIDVTTGTAPGVRIRGDSLATWKEDVLPLRYRTEPSETNTQENQGVWLGWNNRISGPDTTRMGPPAVFALILPDTMGRSWGLESRTTLDFMLTALDRVPGPRRDPAPDEEENREREGPRRGSRGWAPWRFLRGILFGEGDGRESEEPPPLRLSVELTDAEGHSGAVPLDRYGPIRRPIEIRIQRREDQRYRGNSEMVLQTYSIPLSDVVSASVDGLDLNRVKEIRFKFDQSPAGTVVLDEIGFS